jgi:hypothetical protein
MLDIGGIGERVAHKHRLLHLIGLAVCRRVEIGFVVLTSDQRGFEPCIILTLKAIQFPAYGTEELAISRRLDASSSNSTVYRDLVLNVPTISSWTVA